MKKFIRYLASFALAGLMIIPATTTVAKADVTTNTIEKFEVKLENESDFHVDDDGILSITPTQTSNYYLRTYYSIDISTSGSADIPAGQFELHVPGRLFFDRDGNYNTSLDARGTSMTFSIPEGPATSSDTIFNYVYDEESEEYVITNYEPVPAASEMSFSITCSSDFLIQYVKNGSVSDPFYATLYINKEQVASKTIPGIRSYSDIKYSSRSIRSTAYQSSTYPSDWPEEYKPASGKWLYVVWKIGIGSGTDTQKANQTISATVDNSGTILAYRNSQSSTDTKYSTSEISIPFDSYNYSKSEVYVLSAYPLEPLQDGKTHTLGIKATGNAVGLDGASDTKTVSTTTSYKKVEFTAPQGFNVLQSGATWWNITEGTDVSDKISNSYWTFYLSNSSDYSINTNVKDYGMLSYLKANLYSSTKTPALQTTSYLTNFGVACIYPYTFDGDDPTDPSNYGKKPVTVSLVDDTFFLDYDLSHQLTSNDYEIANLTPNYANAEKKSWPSIVASVYKYSSTEEGWKVVSVDASECPAIYIYANRNDGKWERIGQVNIKANKLVDNYGNTLDADDFTGKGYTGIKFETVSSDYQIQISYAVQLSLKPSNYILTKAFSSNRDNHLSDQNTHYLSSVNTLLVKDSDGTVQSIRGSAVGDEELTNFFSERDKRVYGVDSSLYHATSSVVLDETYENAYLQTIVNTSRQSDLNYSVSNQIIVNDTWYGFSFERVNTDIDRFLEGGIIYALLPNGFNIESVEQIQPFTSVVVSDSLKSKQGSGFSVPLNINSTSTVEDYRGSGRTMLIIDFSIKETREAILEKLKKEASRYDLITDLQVRYAFTANGHYSVEDIQDFGSTLQLDAVFKTSKPTYTNNWDAFGVSTAFGTGKDFDSTVSLENVDGKNIGYNIYISNNAQQTVTKGSDSLSALSKAVKDSDSSLYSNGRDGSVIVSDSESYSYRLRFGSSADTENSNIVLFDSLENFTTSSGKTSGWHGILQNIDVSQPRAKGILPVIYYSTVPNLDISSNHDLTNSSTWTTSSPSDMSKVTAVAIDLRKKTDGSDYVLPEKETIRVTVNMKAPSGDAYKNAAIARTRAYNNVYLMSDIKSSTGTESDHFIHYDWTEVRLVEPTPATVSFYGTKILEDQAKTGVALQGNDFSFQLKDASGNVLQTKTNDASGKIKFDDIEYTEEGTYTYTITEVAGSDKHISYDKTVRTITVVVTLDDNFNLVATKQ